jgi:nucleotide-binding universal stress UspA family protein
VTRIIVPLDGSFLAERALLLAAMLACRLGGELRLVEAINLPVGEEMAPWGELEEAARAYLQGQADRVSQGQGVGVSTAAHFGTPDAVIVAEAADSDVEWVVMTTHGREGLQRAVLGSVAEHVLRETPVPVFLLPAAAEGCETKAIKRIAVALDGSPLSEAVLEPLCGLARKLGAAVTLIRVYGEPQSPELSQPGLPARALDQEIESMELLAEEYLESLAGRLRSFGVDTTCVAAVGHKPAEAILRLAASEGADLLAMATHGRSGLDRLRHGSVTEAVLRHSHLPMLAFGRAALERLHTPERRTREYARPNALEPAG